MESEWENGKGDGESGGREGRQEAGNERKGVSGAFRSSVDEIEIQIETCRAYSVSPHMPRKRTRMHAHTHVCRAVSGLGKTWPWTFSHELMDALILARAHLHASQLSRSRRDAGRVKIADFGMAR